MLNNILAELFLYTNRYTIHNSLNLTPTHLNISREVKSEIQGTFNQSGFFIGRTNWLKDINQKETILTFEGNNVIKINHISQEIYSGKLDNLQLSANVSLIGERMTLEYVRMFQTIYEVYHNIKPSNENFTRNNLFQTLSILESMNLID